MITKVSGVPTETKKNAVDTQTRVKQGKNADFPDTGQPFAQWVFPLPADVTVVSLTIERGTDPSSSGYVFLVVDPPLKLIADDKGVRFEKSE